MPDPLPPLPAPSPAQVHLAWLRTFALPADPGAEPPGERERQLGVLLDGLPLVAARRVPDETGQELALGNMLDRLIAHEPAAGWQAEVRGGGPALRPFLAELARRVLALGFLREGYAEDDPLLNPHSTRIDPECTDAPLAFARAVTAVELHDSELLAVVVGRHLRWRAGEAEAGRARPVLPWLGPLLEDPAAQCLLVAALGSWEPGRDPEGKKGLFRRLVVSYEDCRGQDGAAPPGWPAGPLTTCCALGLLLRRPREVSLLAEFKNHVEDWPGWQDEDAWPTRHPGASLADLKARLTERAAAAFGVGGRKVWPRAALAPPLESCWPPLLAFCFPVTPRAPGDGGPAALPQGRGERDEPHP
jgi:hypothetical protein